MWAGHAEQLPLAVSTPVTSPLNPALHLHADAAMLPDGLAESPGQAMQDAVPVSPLKVSAGHSLHDPLPVYPTSHKQFVAAVLPAGPIEWSGQARQLAKPILSLYFPATQRTQMPTASVVPVAVTTLLITPSYPSMQTQSEAASDCAGETVLGGHATHASVP